MDILLLIYTIIVGFYFFLAPQREAILFEPAKWISFLLCYIIVRKIAQKQWYLWGILFLGVTEAIIGVCQKMHWVNSLHSAFDITGTFGNPGPLGGCLAIAITVTVGLYIEYRMRSRLRWVLLLSLLLLFITIVFTESRAGWLAAFTGIGSFYFFKRKQQRFSFTVFQKIAITITVLAFFISTYYYKKDSADGRLLIWRVSTEMIVDASLVGRGVGAFERKYMYYQGRYFNSHPDSQYSILVDDIAYPYNDAFTIAKIEETHKQKRINILNGKKKNAEKEVEFMAIDDKMAKEITTAAPSASACWEKVNNARLDHNMKTK